MFESTSTIPSITIVTSRCLRPVLSDLNQKLKPFLDNVWYTLTLAYVFVL